METVWLRKAARRLCVAHAEAGAKPRIAVSEINRVIQSINDTLKSRKPEYLHIF